MNSPRGKSIDVLVFSACLILLGYSGYRDFRFGKDFIGDLRNRVTGARIIRDGKSPYFYRWKASDGIRYYDPQNFNNLKVSNVTASPFFLRLFDPLAEWPQSKINIGWCSIQYIMLLVMTGMAFGLAKTELQKWATLSTATLFLYTDAWKSLILLGQYYLCIPFLAMFIFYFLQKGKRPVWLFLAGLASVTLVLIRPNALVFFIPFVFLLPGYNRRERLAFLIPVLLVLCWAFASNKDRFLWSDYTRSLGEQVKYHQDLYPALQNNPPDPGFAEWEGVKRTVQIAQYRKSPINIDSENGNIFYLIKLLFHWKIPVNTLLTAMVTTITLLTGVYYYRGRDRRRDRRSPGFDLVHTLLFGYGLYMISDLFSPVFRTQHYTVQCLFPLLVAAGVYCPPSPDNPSPRWVYPLLLTGLLMNISRIPFIKMEHTLGEYLIIGVIILFSLTKPRETPKETKITE